MRRLLAPVAALAALTTAVLAGLVAPPAGAAAPAAAAYTGSLVDAIARLPVAAEVRTGYDRTLFRHWVDADGDCQNARAEVLLVETTAPVTFTSSSNCTVATGRWVSYYDAVVVTTASGVDIDHMVPLAEAWDSGASGWTAARRQAYANDLDDPRSLVAVTGSSNSSKSDSDPAEWLPAYERCRYVTEWTAVKTRWSLTVDQAEKTALAGLAGGCGAVTLTVEVLDGGSTPPDTTAPSTPTGLVATATSSTAVTLGWTASTDAVGVTGYRITRNGTLVATVATPGYADTGLTASTVYSYGVVAVDAAGNASAAATVSVTTPAAPLVLSGATRIVGTAKYADLSWTGGGTRFDLWRGSTRLMANTTVRSTTNRVGASTTSATYTVCPAGTSRTSAGCSSVTLRW